MRETTFDVIGNVPDGSNAMVGCFLAGEYHTGQWSQLYQLASSGEVTDLFYLARELRDAITTAENEYPDDIEDLTPLAEWVEAVDEFTPDPL